MSVQVSLHFRSGLEVMDASVHPTKEFATISLCETGKDESWPCLFFNRVSDMDTLIAALTKLRGEFAAAQSADDTVPIGIEDEAASMPITTVLGGES